MAQHCQDGFACFVQLESCTSLQITVYKPKLPTNSFLALRVGTRSEGAQQAAAWRGESAGGELGAETAGGGGGG